MSRLSFHAQKIRAVSGPFSLALLFGLFCVLKLWYAPLIFFALSLILALILKKRSYCYYFCPTGTVADFFFDPKNQTKKVRAFPASAVIPALVFLIFWGFAAGVILSDLESFTRWRLFFYFAWAVVALSAGLQWFFGKREWCASLCPLGRVQGWIVKFMRTIRR